MLIESGATKHNSFYVGQINFSLSQKIPNFLKKKFPNTVAISIMFTYTACEKEKVHFLNAILSSVVWFEFFLLENYHLAAPPAAAPPRPPRPPPPRGV